MSKIIELTDEQYAALMRVAQERGLTPERLVAEVIIELGDHPPQYYETRDWFRHIGMIDEVKTMSYSNLPELREQVRGLARSGPAEGR